MVVMGERYGPLQNTLILVLILSPWSNVITRRFFSSDSTNLCSPPVSPTPPSQPQWGSVVRSVAGESPTTRSDKIVSSRVIVERFLLISVVSASAPNLQWTTLPRLEDSYCKTKYNQRSKLFLENVMICAGVKVTN